LRPDEKVTALTGVVMSYSPYVWRFSHDTQLGDLLAKGGETMYLLTYQGNAIWKAWFRGRLHDDIDCGNAECLDFCTIDWAYFCSDEPVAAVRNPKRIWWVKIQNAKGLVGWAAVAAGDFDTKP
jgi:hypothetical protein